MREVRQYSSYFFCLYDECASVGSLGRGTHYSVFRSVEWLDVDRRRIDLPQVHDFAVIWDEDHDERVIEAIERFYMAGLLSPVQFIGERKGGLTLILAARFYFSGTSESLQAYVSAVTAIASGLPDGWTVEIGSFDRNLGSPHQTFFQGIIADDDRRVGLYLANIDSLWRLGTRPYRPTMPLKLSLPPIPDARLAASLSQPQSLSMPAPPPSPSAFPPEFLPPRT